MIPPDTPTKTEPLALAIKKSESGGFFASLFKCQCAAKKLKTFYFPFFASRYHRLIRLIERKYVSGAISLDTKTSAPRLYPHAWPQIVQSHETIKKSIKSPLQNLKLTPKVPNSSKVVNAHLSVEQSLFTCRTFVLINWSHISVYWGNLWPQCAHNARHGKSLNNFCDQFQDEIFCRTEMLFCG